MFDIVRGVGLVFVVLILLVTANTFGQSGSTASACGINRINLEDNIKRPYFDSVGNPKGSQFTQETMIIVIASLGSRETSRKYNIQRAKQVKEYITLNFAFPDKLIVLAQGEKKKDEGRVDIYYGGTLQMYITFKPNER